ncbi:MAG: enoyl-CoA hydratase-related protein [Pseudomonadales bacterium]|nr:enoyl-CoA hydratase-related protein [Pseudomonadales bacterium]MDP6471107.1 enoyl-CoA hydratase-related protein [Pseudomonadales bacterium]MDP6825707.1 enoyl-CoA hydratase-related protein [Pseudomonadales bacterium]MDP6973163.1 enoyl-CoA hydratase-related protein [Pseudomonadales bacterium]
MTQYTKIAIDDPRPAVRRITLNRPEKRNPLSNELRGEMFHALETADQDAEVRVMIIRGAGPCFSAGYDLQSNVAQGQPFYTAGGLANWPRHVVEGFFKIWDLAKPVIAQVHGYCLAGGTELATACDLVYVAQDAKIGYPVVRSISPPDNQFYPWIVGLRRAMELMLTGDHMSGIEAAESGFANRAFPVDQLEDRVLEIAERVAMTPTDLQQMNKRAVHRQMDAMGIRAGIRAGTEMQQLATFTQSTQAHLAEIRKGLTQALTKRDEAFGDYRTSKED